MRTELWFATEGAFDHTVRGKAESGESTFLLSFAHFQSIRGGPTTGGHRGSRLQRQRVSSHQDCFKKDRAMLTAGIGMFQTEGTARPSRAWSCWSNRKKAREGHEVESGLGWHREEGLG